MSAVVPLVSGAGCGAYILAWIFVPEARSDAPIVAPTDPADAKDRGMQIFGIVLLALAVSVLWGDWWSPSRRWLFPVGRMALGACLLHERQSGMEGQILSLRDNIVGTRYFKTKLRTYK